MTVAIDIDEFECAVVEDDRVVVALFYMKSDARLFVRAIRENYGNNVVIRIQDVAR